MRALNQNTPASLDAARATSNKRPNLTRAMAWRGTGWPDSAIDEADNGLLPLAEGYERARELAQRALELSPDLREAHVALQYVYQTSDWDWAAAESRRAAGSRN